MIPGKTFTYRHSIEWNQNLAISDIFDAVAGEYNAVDLPGWTYGLLIRVRGGHSGLTSADTDVGTSSGKLAWHTISRWRYHQQGATIDTAPVVSMASDTFTPLATEEIMGAGVDAAVPLKQL